jgi:ATP-dependent RNA helicase DDX19/DBP5
MATAAKTSHEQDWADVEDDDDFGDDPPTVQVDSLDFKSLSFDDKPSTASESSRKVWVNLLGDAPVKSLTDRISSEETAKEPVNKDGEEAKTSPPVVEKGEQAALQDTNLIQSKYEVAVKLQDLQADPNSPLYSVKSFDELGLYCASKFRFLTIDIPICWKAFMRWNSRNLPKFRNVLCPYSFLIRMNFTIVHTNYSPRNMIGQSQSGTGKTAAFVLTMLSRIDYDRQVVQAVCLAPTRELARQIVDVVREMGKFTPVKVTLAVKEGVPRGEQLNDHVVVGTPGTVMDLLRRRSLDARNVNVFVLDEADNMLDLQGMGEQSLRVKKYFPVKMTN